MYHMVLMYSRVYSIFLTHECHLCAIRKSHFILLHFTLSINKELEKAMMK